MLDSGLFLVEQDLSDMKRSTNVQEKHDFWWIFTTEEICVPYYTVKTEIGKACFDWRCEEQEVIGIKHEGIQRAYQIKTTRTNKRKQEVNVRK